MALTLTPALSLIFFRKGVRNSAEPWLQRFLKRVYGFLLSFIFRWPRTIVGVVLVICVVALTRLPFFGGEFLPEFREGHFVLQVSTIPGTSLPEMLRIGYEISGCPAAKTRI